MIPRLSRRALAAALLVPAAAGLAAGTAAAQAPRAVTADDYARAERFLGQRTVPLVYGAYVRPGWLSGDRFWYATGTPDGMQYILVDPAKGTRARAFDPARLLPALQQAAGQQTLPPLGVIFQDLDVAPDGHLRLSVAGTRYDCDPMTNRCGAAVGDREITAGNTRPATGRRRGGAPISTSPDGRRAVLVRDWNLWVRDLASGQERQLTRDGVKDFGYATDNAGWTHSDRPIVAWSPDSRKVATFQQDQRGVGEMYTVSTTTGHPRLEAWKYPLPGDSVITTIQRVIVDVDSGTVTRFRMPPDQHRSTLCDDVSCAGDFTDVEWYPDGSHVAFVSTSRDHRHEVLRVADARSGEVRDVLHEDARTQYESGNGRANWQILPATNEVLWYSERDDWGNLYLYDLASGRLKRQVTTGPGNVAELVKVDPASRTVWFVGNGKTPGWDPYFRALYRVGIDGKGTALLTPENADHTITLAPGARWFVDAWSRPEVPPTTVVRDLNGTTLVQVEKADVSRLVATGWKPPVPITVKARDGKTDLYGLMYVPTNLDSTRKYPIVNHIYPGPQTGSVGGRSWSPARGDAQALAELGFVVVEIDGMGTPWRSKSFHDAYYAHMGDNTLPDQVAGMQELARRYRWIDVERAGIYGHSGGGFAAADAMFRYPDFFKVGISEAGNHDNRVYEDDWGERYQGLLVRGPNGEDNYAPEANQLYARNLKGKLLLAHGTTDDNVPPNNTLLVVDALIAANKDFDLIMLPNRAHGFGSEPYMVRRRWDYFVRNLLGAEPPHEFDLRGPQTTRVTP